MMKRLCAAVLAFLLLFALVVKGETVQESSSEGAVQEPVSTDMATSGEQGKKELYDLSYKFPQGKELFYRMDFDREDEFNIGGKNVKIAKKTLLYISQLFESVDGDGNGSGKLFYLQGWQDGQRIFPQQKVVTLKVSPGGDVLETAGLQEVAAEFLKVIQRTIADYIPGFDRLPLKIDLTKAPSNTFNPFLQSFILPLPARPVATGEKWTRGDKNIGNVEFTLQKVEGNNAYIEMYAEGRNGIVKGDAVFDLAEGIVISQKVRTDTDATGRVVERIAKEIEIPEEGRKFNVPEKTHMTITMVLMPSE